jgi:hypothetical protein
MYLGGGMLARAVFAFLEDCGQFFSTVNTPVYIVCTARIDFIHEALSLAIMLTISRAE